MNSEWDGMGWDGTYGSYPFYPVTTARAPGVLKNGLDTRAKNIENVF